MRSNLSRWLLTAALAGSSLLTVSTASAQPNVRDHRGPRPAPPPPPPPQGAPVADTGPREAPPPPKAEKIGRRRGWTWVAGNWDWKNGAWTWEAGHWEKERRGKRFRERRWENQGGKWVRIEGDWQDDRPNAAPPAPQEEKWQPRAGFVWVRGNWDWNNGNWDWTPGHWERERAGKRWREPRWEQQGGQWVLVAGDWQDDRPNAAPPAPQDEKWEPRRGFVWVKGNWDWKNGNWQWVPGHWERERRGKRWREARWENQGGQWVMSATPGSSSRHRRRTRRACPRALLVAAGQVIEHVFERASIHPLRGTVVCASMAREHDLLFLLSQRTTVQDAIHRGGPRQAAHRQQRRRNHRLHTHQLCCFVDTERGFELLPVVGAELVLERRAVLARDVELPRTRQIRLHGEDRFLLELLPHDVGQARRRIDAHVHRAEQVGRLAVLLDLPEQWLL